MTKKPKLSSFEGPMTKKIPDFKSEKEEKEFWKTHDVREYINWNNAEPFVKRVFKNKKTETELLKELKQKITGD